MDTVAFLKALRPNGPWTLTAIYEGQATLPTLYSSSPEEVTTWLAQHIGKANLYYQANPTKPVYKRPKAEDFAAVEYLHVDIDYNAAGNRLTSPELRQPVIEQVRQFAPTFIMSTGNGVQALWRINPMGATEGTLTLAQLANEGLATTLGGDHISDATHLLRLPGTPNIPTAKKRAAGIGQSVAEVLEYTDNAPKELFDFPAATPKSKLKVEANITAAQETNLAELEGKYKVPTEIIEALRNGRHNQATDDMSRSESVWYVTNSLLQYHVPPDKVLYCLLNPDWGLSESIYDHEARSPEDQAIRQIERCYTHLVASAIEGLPADLPQLDIAPNSPGAPAQRERFRIYRYDELANEPDVDWLIKEWLQERVSALIFGPPASYKTFVALDMALHIVTGKAWRGAEVRRGEVLYVLGEGKEGIYKRLSAWVSTNVACDDDMGHVREHFGVIKEPVYLDDFGDTGALGQFITKYKGAKFDLIVLDTLNRNMLGDENSTQDMSKVIRGCDLMSQCFGCTVLIVHHTGWGNTGRERGNSAMRGALNNAIRVEAVKQTKRGTPIAAITVRMEKSKDGPEGGTVELAPTLTLGSIALYPVPSVEVGLNHNLDLEPDCS